MNRFNRACVVGAGTMGHGIAYILAEAKIDVCLIDQSKASVELGFANIERLVESFVVKQKITTAEANNLLSRVSMSCDLDSLSNADLMIEAVNEDIEQKRHIFSIADAL